jgi:hypothetical protein
MKKLLFILLIIVYSHPLAAQSIEDSLLHVINTAKEDSSKIDAINAFPLAIILLIPVFFTPGK